MFNMAMQQSCAINQTQLDADRKTAETQYTRVSIDGTAYTVSRATRNRMFEMQAEWHEHERVLLVPGKPSLLDGNARVSLEKLCLEAFRYTEEKRDVTAWKAYANCLARALREAVYA